MDTIENSRKNSDELDVILKKSFTESFQLATINGAVMKAAFLSLAEDILNWEANDDDVWICTFPKSGTTWTQEMVWMIMNNVDFKRGQENLEYRSPFLELSAQIDFDEFKRKNTAFSAFNNSLEYVKSLKSPTCIKTHIPFNLLPKQIQNGKKKPKIIYVSRNPKDACVSFYHHQKLTNEYIGNFDDYCKLFLTGRIISGPYWKHIFSYWNQRHQMKNITFIKYEDMKNDLPSVIRKIAIFLEKSLTDQQIDDLTKHLNFANMKNNAAVNKESYFNNLKNRTNTEGHFMRSGLIGDYKRHMKSEIVDEFNRWIDIHTKDSEFKVYSV